ncbi:uncharacterized protein L201_004822 [Kwoniella dendrophila CBS 6074]|uniref:Uncharacterized protein n=1 Tax=Kwoniella dendrophila CBS 6074 TaxID=1295534 RepID=A0AAX4JZF6_9TREE
MHFEIYVKKLGVQHTASPGRDTVHQLLVARQNDILLTPEKNPQYGHLGKTKGGHEFTKIQNQLNVDVFGQDDLVVSLLVANIAHGTKSYMEDICHVIEGRNTRHQIIQHSGPAVYGLSFPTTQQALDVATAEITRKLGENVARAMDHAIDHFTNVTQNHDCIVLYDTLTIVRPDLWNVGQEKEFRTPRALAGITRGNPRYTMDVVIKRHS